MNMNRIFSLKRLIEEHGCIVEVDTISSFLILQKTLKRIYVFNDLQLLRLIISEELNTVNVLTVQTKCIPLNEKILCLVCLPLKLITCWGGT